VGICLLLALAVWVVFGQTLRHEFVDYDDNRFVYENPATTQGLSLKGVLWAFTHVNAKEWYPLTSISHMLDWQLFGSNAGGHHFTNVLLHAASVILFFLVVRNMTGVLWPAAFVAAVFAIHPLRVESVAWITERKDVLSGLFFMLTLWAYAKYVSGVRCQVSGVRTDGPRGNRQSAIGNWKWYSLALLFFALGLLSKTMLVTLPFVLLLLDYWPLGRVSGVRCQVPGAESGAPDLTPRTSHLALLLEKLPFLLLSAAACVATILAQTEAIQSVGFPARIGNAFQSYVAYIGQMLYPVGLAVFYPHPGDQLPLWKTAVSVAVLLVITVGVLASWRKHPYLLVGWLWYLGMLVPVIGVLQVGGQARADRYTYLPQIGLYLLVVWGALALCARRLRGRRRRALPIVAALIVAALMALAYAQTTHWRDSVSLWTHALACTPGNQVAHNNLGLELVAQGKLNEAIEHYELALESAPDHVNARNNIGLALVTQGKLKEAIAHFSRALQLQPGNAQTHCNLGMALVRNEQWCDARLEFQQALEIAPDSTQALNNLAWLLATCPEAAVRDGDRAVQLAQELRRVTGGKRPTYLDTLAAAYAEAGRFTDAVATANEAIHLAKASGNAKLAEDIGARLPLYENKQPFRESAREDRGATTQN
jgi:tetratricopeptide (TPR) repeat protein